MLNVYGLTREGWSSLFHGTPECEEISEVSCRAKVRNVLKALYVQGLTGPECVGKRALRLLPEPLVWSCPVILEQAIESEQDGSVKLLLRQSATGLLFESVLIPERGRLTQCLSSQVGCAQGCRFCQTGRMGLLSSLSAAEIVAQVVVGQNYWTRRILRSAAGGEFGADKVTNVVFMGMGEPLANRLEVQKACEILADPWGLAIGRSRITVSTVGLLPELAHFLDESNVGIALSLHSPFDDERSKVMPVNKENPLAKVLQVLREKLRHGCHVFVQYTLIRGVNDSRAHADALAECLIGLPCKINLIPLNEHDGAAFRRPNFEQIEAFRSALKEKGYVVTVRFSKGRAIDAACGQLVKSVERGKAIDKNPHTFQ